eukprot:gene6529-biopygen4406
MRSMRPMRPMRPMRWKLRTDRHTDRHTEDKPAQHPAPTQEIRIPPTCTDVAVAENRQLASYPDPNLFCSPVLLPDQEGGRSAACMATVSGIIVLPLSPVRRWSMQLWSARPWSVRLWSARLLLEALLLVEAGCALGTPERQGSSGKCWRGLRALSPCSPDLRAGSAAPVAVQPGAAFWARAWRRPRVGCPAAYVCRSRERCVLSLPVPSPACRRRCC